MPKKNIRFRSLAFGFLLFLPTTIFAPNALYIPIFLAIFLCSGVLKGQKIKLGVLLVFSWLISFGLLVFNKADIVYLDNFIPIQLGLLITFLAAISLRKYSLVWVVPWIAFEGTVALAQFLTGMSFGNFYMGTGSNLQMEVESGLLYQMRVMGLSSNSSVLALKVLLSVAIVEHFKLKEKVGRVPYCLFYLVTLVTLVVTFSRSGLVALAFFFILRQLMTIFSLRTMMLIFVSSLTLLAIWSLGGIDEIINQFNRGRSSSDISGRDLIWYSYIENIYDNYMWGKYGFKNYLSIAPWGPMHAHNSYIFLIFILGLPALIPLLAFYGVGFILQPRVLLYFSPVFIYSLAQTVLFWGVSFADFVLLTLLFGKVEYTDNDD